MSQPQLAGVNVDEILIVHAGPAESPGVVSDRVIELGVGKVNATATLYAALLAFEVQQRRISAVMLVGIAGAYPDRHRHKPGPVRLGDVCVVGSDALADEGVATEQGFLDGGTAVFGSGQRLLDTGPFPASPRLAAEAAKMLQVPIVRGATVSTCSGSEVTSRQLHERTHADVETMEGAAVAAVCRRREVQLLHLRAISNWTGDRARGEWNIGRAIDALRLAVRRLLK